MDPPPIPSASPGTRRLISTETRNNLIAGTFGGIAGVIVGQPFDTVKVKLQTGHHPNKNKSMIQTIKQIVQQDSIRGLFKGMTSPMLGVAVINALLFGVYGYMLEKQQHHQSNGGGGLMPVLIAGSVSGFVNGFVSCPIELVKIKVQTGILRRNPLTCTTQMVRTYGLRNGLFLGLAPTLVRETPSYGVYFVMYEYMCRQFHTYCDDRHPCTKSDDDVLDSKYLLIAGGVSGIAGWMSSYPADVVKTKIQASNPGTYKGFVDCARQTILSEGYMGLWRGSLATIIRAFPTNAATFLVWHHIMTALK